MLRFIHGEKKFRCFVFEVNFLATSQYRIYHIDSSEKHTSENVIKEPQGDYPLMLDYLQIKLATCEFSVIFYIFLQQRRNVYLFHRENKMKIFM